MAWAPLAATLMIFVVLLLLDSRKPPEQARLTTRTSQASVFFFLLMLSTIGYHFMSGALPDLEGGAGPNEPIGRLKPTVETEFVKRISFEPVHVGTPQF